TPCSRFPIRASSLHARRGSFPSPPRQPDRPLAVSGPLSVTFIAPAVRTPPLMGSFPAGHGAKTLLWENGSTESFTDSSVSPDRPLGPRGPGGPCWPAEPGGPARPWGPGGPGGPGNPSGPGGPTAPSVTWKGSEWTCTETGTGSGRMTTSQYDPRA